jgi:SAM-dependent methyltransferase
VNREFDLLVADAVQAARNAEGWDFSYVSERRHVDSPPWSWTDTVISLLQDVHDMLDMDTGGGEVLIGIHHNAEHWPDRVWATEGYPPNLPVAARNLARIGTNVVGFETHEHLPFADDSLDLITNRHGDFHPPEIWRLLRPGGLFVTQQIQFGAVQDPNDLIGGPGPAYEKLDLNTVVERFEDAGFVTNQQNEFRGRDLFDDVGAFVFTLTMAPWEVSDFSVAAYRDRLLDLHTRILRDGPLDIGIGFWLLLMQKST